MEKERDYHSFDSEEIESVDIVIDAGYTKIEVTTKDGQYFLAESDY